MAVTTQYEVIEIGPFDRAKLNSAEPPLIKAMTAQGFRLVAVCSEHHAHVTGQHIRRYHFARDV